MTDLQKNQAIYQAMCEIAEKYFNRVIENSQKFREYMAEKFIISIKELENEPIWNSVQSDITFDDETITLDTFQCTFKGDNVFHLMQKFKSIAKVKGDYLFTYEEKLPNEHIGSVDITFDNPAAAKNLSNHLSVHDELCPVFNHILLDIDTSTFNINFIASDKNALGIISNDKKKMMGNDVNRGYCYQALFSKISWKRICDYARKMKVSVTFEIYKRAENELQDTMIAVLGDARIKSIRINMRYPNWRGVLQKNADKHFRIHLDEIKAAQKFVKSLKLTNDYAMARQTINVSFYRGSDRVYFDFFDICSNATKTASFLLTRPSEITIGVNYHLARLQKIKFTGFNIQSVEYCSIIDCEETDFMQVFHVFREDGYVFDVNDREVVEVLDDAVMVA